MSDQFDAPAKPIERDRWGRPLVAPPGGGKAIAYQRCTTFVDCMEDKFNLQQWQLRMTALGLASRPDLLLAVSANTDMADGTQKKELNRITDAAKEAAAASAAATTGTAIHALTEKIDRGEELPPIPDAARADLEAYRHATSALRVHAIEQFSVQDELRVGGTCDRVYEYEGRFYIGDVKTGNIDYGAMKIAMQLAVYSRSVPYNHVVKRREPRTYEVDTSRAIVVHLPAGSGTCELRWVDLSRGWQAVAVATQVRAWRKVKDWYQPFTASSTGGTDIGTGAELAEEATNLYIDTEVDKASTLDELRATYTRLVKNGEDADRVLAACDRRRGELGATV